ncbi:MAG: hypothetical protein ACJ77K_06320 [Bacteroidia bacterium]
MISLLKNKRFAGNFILLVILFSGFGIGYAQTDSLSKMGKLGKIINIDTTSEGNLQRPSLDTSLSSLQLKSLTDSSLFKTGYERLIPEKPSGVISGIRKDTTISATDLLRSNSDKIMKPGSDLLSKGKNILPDSNSSPELKQQVIGNLKAIQPRGYLSAGYQYGVLPFVSSSHFPSGGFQSEGDVSLLLAGLPIKVMYDYTTVKNVIGLNNYFRISFDTERYKDQLNNKLDLKNKVSKQELTKMELDQQPLMKKIEYLRFLQKMPQVQKPGATVPSGSIDTTVITGAIPEYSAPAYSASIDSSEYLRKKDSIATELNRYQKLYDSTAGEIAALKKQIGQIENYQNNPPQFSNPYLTKVQQILSGIRKFEIGLCHPSYSTFLVNSIPVQGINLEYAQNNNFLAFTYGTTINNLLFNTSTLQSAIETGRNLYNYFDFGNLDGGRKILCLKGGFGSKENTHLYAGFLLGKGRADYMTLLSGDLSHRDYSKESNAVIELDARYKFSEKLSADLVVGKSSLKNQDLSGEQVSLALEEIFSAYRSNALLFRVNGSISKSKTKLIFTARYVDPYFKSFGIGFMRSDNFRYEIKAEQPIGRRIKYTIAYRKEQDNLLRLYNYQNTLQSISNTLNLKLSRQLNIRLIYTPLFRELRSGETIVRDRNDISTAILSYSTRPKKVTAQFTALYSRYLITGDSLDIDFENISYSHQITTRSGFKTDLTVSWFKNNLADSTGNDTYLSVADLGYQGKKGNALTVGGKCAVRLDMLPQYGFIVRGRIKLCKGLSWEAEAEKILIGDYYNTLMTPDIDKFPYYMSTKLILNF